ncbi:MAG: ankyrin repeat domain-containing protein, partial [Spirochaetaceae bacterium]|nr:ankyrin repeat domain-containing protein [Spirochaetaceae bacterium]
PDSRTPTDEPLILLAARQFNWDIVFLLIEYKASFAVIDSRKRTLLHYAAIDGHEGIVKKLLTLGINKRFTDIEGETALSLAEKNHHTSLLPLLE